MAFDFKKEYKEFYMPKNKPEIVNVPKANYIAVRGKGNPNEEGGAYQVDMKKCALCYKCLIECPNDAIIEKDFELERQTPSKYTNTQARKRISW